MNPEPSACKTQTLKLKSVSGDDDSERIQNQTPQNNKNKHNKNLNEMNKQRKADNPLTSCVPGALSINSRGLVSRRLCCCSLLGCGLSNS